MRTTQDIRTKVERTRNERRASAGPLPLEASSDQPMPTFVVASPYGGIKHKTPLGDMFPPVVFSPL